MVSTSDLKGCPGLDRDADRGPTPRAPGLFRTPKGPSRTRDPEDPKQSEPSTDTVLRQCPSGCVEVAARPAPTLVDKTFEDVDDLSPPMVNGGWNVSGVSQVPETKTGNISCSWVLQSTDLTVLH